MPQRSRYGAVNRLNPEAAGRCDRGGEIRKRSELLVEMRWAGNALVPTGFLCCREHIDPPQPQDRLLVLGPDPIPVDNARPDIDAILGNQISVLQAETGEWLYTEDREPILTGLGRALSPPPPPPPPPVPPEALLTQSDEPLLDQDFEVLTL